MNTAFRRFAPPVMGAGAALLHGLVVTPDNKSQTEGSKTNNPGPRLMFAGTGSSTGCPKPLCSMIFGPNHSASLETPEVKLLREQYQHRCRTSQVATQGDPKHNKNYRNNPALVVSHCDGDECKSFIIDAGKTFREAGLRWFPEHQVTTLDAIILTHHHMDAAGGLDDVRGFQHMAVPGTHKKLPQMVPMPLHVSEFCLQDVAQRFPWLFPKQQPGYKSGLDDKPAVDRHVASFDVQVFEDFQPMNVAGLKVIPLPVWHGDDLISYGFAFSLNSTNVVYISDISKMIPETMEYILNRLPPTDILIVDALLPEHPHPAHFSLNQALELAEQMQAKQTYLVGMNCDAFPLHDEMNQKLQKQCDGKVQLAYDGQVVNL